MIERRFLMLLYPSLFELSRTSPAMTSVSLPASFWKTCQLSKTLKLNLSPHSRNFETDWESETDNSSLFVLHNCIPQILNHKSVLTKEKKKNSSICVFQELSQILRMARIFIRKERRKVFLILPAFKCWIDSKSLVFWGGFYFLKLLYRSLEWNCFSTLWSLHQCCFLEN